MKTLSLLVLAIAVVACGNKSSGGGGGGGGGMIDAPAGGGQHDAPVQTPDAPAGANTITGMVSGTGFTTVGASYWIGSPDSPATDTVVYLFDKAVQCSQIVAAGWDVSVLTAGTQILELKMVGKAPKAYPVTMQAQHVPAAGESVAAYSVAGAGAMDNFSTATSITLTTIGTPANGQFASGSFQLTVTGGTLSGTYAAPYCAAGREP